MRTATLFLIALLPVSGHAQAQAGAKSLSQIELNAWSAYCSSELGGNQTVCGCVLEKQFEQNDPAIVSGALLQMVGDDPNATDSDGNSARDALQSMYGGDPDGPADAREAFRATLDDNLNACTPADD